MVPKKYENAGKRRLTSMCQQNILDQDMGIILTETLRC